MTGVAHRGRPLPLPNRDRPCPPTFSAFGRGPFIALPLRLRSPPSTTPAGRLMTRLARIFALVAAFCLIGGAAVSAADLENTIYMDVPKGRVVIELRPDLAPNHVAQIKELTRRGFYDGVPFHRVIDGFMAQTGDPTGTGTGGSGKKIKAE